ncbi:MAG TPA: AzlC family ABC transporter permease, partial [Quisquiliibacterium sp.]|nr:AzlC family ABC transporter permease [Quisquiliibacterium sp.]
MPLHRSPAVRIGLSISVATGLYGISFGALAMAAGLDLWQTMALSLLMFTGGSQFAFIGVVAGGGTGAAASGAATLLGVRNAVYGMQLNRMLAPRGWRR